MYSDRESLDSFKNLILFAIVALLVHWSIREIPLSVFDAGLMSRKPAEKTVEIEKYVENETGKPVVKTLKALEQDESRKEANFAGEFKNRVKKETRSPLTGKFSMGGAPKNVDPLGLGQGIQALLPFGRTPNKLPNDISEGNETVLNTDPVLYASFINRIADELYDVWVDYAHEAVDLLSHSGRHLEVNDYVTKLQIVMDSEGSIKAIQVLASSGIPEFDEAPKRAFWDVEPFANPPSQMFKRDNLVRFVYEFSLELKGSAFSITPSAI